MVYLVNVKYNVINDTLQKHDKTCTIFKGHTLFVLILILISRTVSRKSEWLDW